MYRHENAVELIITPYHAVQVRSRCDYQN